MSDRKPAFKKTQRQHPAAPAAEAAAATTATAEPEAPTAPTSPPSAAAPRARAKTPGGKFKHQNSDYVQLNALVHKDLRRRLKVLVAQDDSVKVGEHVERALQQYLDGLAS